MQEIVEKTTKSKERELVMGNEAIAYGLFDGGTTFVSSYPGTPSTEIMEKSIRLSRDDFHADWATNEAVAFEEAMAAAILGKDSAFICKSVGLNVAMDPLMTLANSGVNGSFLIIVADDPAMHSSQNEQDNRLVGLFSNLPVFEPANVQEGYFYTREAIKLSRKYKVPVIIRSVTRLSHSLGSLIRENRIKLDEIEYKPDRARFVSIPANARRNHERILKIHETLAQDAEREGYWKEYITEEDPEYLVFTCGNAGNHVIEAFEGFELPAHIISFKLVNPLPREKIEELLQSYNKILVIEELEPYLERFIKVVAQEIGITTKILGKGDITSRLGEITTDFLKQHLADTLNLHYIPPKVVEPAALDLLRIRPPVLCAGCPHRSTYVMLERVMKRYDAVYCNDIGCYSLGFLPPHNAADMLICMGASIPMATSVAINDPEKTAVAVIGDSTFWHSGLSGLANAIWKKANILVLVVDNATTAMTGAQPNPTSQDGILDIAKVSAAMGAHAFEIDPMEFKPSVDVVKKAMELDGVKVVVSKYPCALQDNRAKAKAGIKVPKMEIDEEKCNGCNLCASTLGCPALSVGDRGVGEIDPALCNGCTYCTQFCHRDAILEVWDE